MSRRRQAVAENALVLKLADTLQGAVDLMQDAAYSQGTPPLDDAEHASLLQHCLALCAQQESQAPEPVRTLHHLACTGGTLISKCIAAMPNVQLLSEVDPLSVNHLYPDKPSFSPTDMLTLMRQSSRGTREALLVELFQTGMRVIYRDAVQQGQRLVLRDHASSHFCRGSTVPDRPNLRAMIPPEIPMLSVVTVRHPLDSYASLLHNGWVHFQPSTFDVYCHRHLVFLDSYADLPVVRYEDFVAAPAATMQRLCAALELPFNAHFASLFPAFKMSGDSGRASNTIQARTSRPAASQLVNEAKNSVHFKSLMARLGYDAALPNSAC